MAEESSTKAPTLLPTYTLGTEGKPHHFTATTTREAAGIEAKSLNVNDAAFIKRSDLKWTYAIVTEKVEDGVDAAGDGKTILRFEVDKEANRKSFPENQWGKYIRVIKVDEEELAKLQAEEDAAKNEDEAPKEEAKPEEAKDDEIKQEEAKEDGVDAKLESVASAAEESVASHKSNKSSSSHKSNKSSSSLKSNKSSSSHKSNKSSSSWFGKSVSGFFGGSAKAEVNVPAAVPEETVADVAATSVADDQPAAESATAPSAGATITSQDTPTTPAPADTSAALAVETPIEKHTASDESIKEEDPAAIAVDTTFTAPTEATKEEAQSEPDNTKENSNPSEPVELTKSSDSATEPAPATIKLDTISALRSPLNSLRQPVSLKKKSSLVNKLFGKNKNKVDTSSSPTLADKKVLITTPRSAAANAAALGANPKSPKNNTDAPVESKKEWFDPEASEVDYDKSPTDLFQALEARQFEYVDEMFQQVNRQFTKECRTWVVARGHKKKDQLRFRALPLHAALVFGAPDEITIKILNAYPNATRGRDVKGRLPIHLAMEHDASETIVSLILEAFPKGFFAKDKKDMESIDYVNGNMGRSYMKRYVPLIIAAKVEDERVKWQGEVEEALEAQKETLKTDPVYMEDVIESITDIVETNCATKMEMIESNYKKEILLLKKKHDSETQALLEGFEVKLNFERKLQKLKSVNV